MKMGGSSHVLLSWSLALCTLLVVTVAYPSTHGSRNDFMEALRRIEDLENVDRVGPSELQPPQIIDQKQGYYDDYTDDVISDALYKAYIEKLLTEAMDNPEPDYSDETNGYYDNVPYYPQYAADPYDDQVASFSDADEGDKNAEALFSYLLNYDSEVYKFPESGAQSMEEDIPPFVPPPAPAMDQSGNEFDISDNELADLADWLSQQGNEVYLAALVEYLKQRLALEISAEEVKIKALQDAYVSLIDTASYDIGMDDNDQGLNSYVLPINSGYQQPYYYYDPYYAEERSDTRRFVPDQQYTEDEVEEEEVSETTDEDDSELIGLMQMLGINPDEYEAVKQQTQEKEIEEQEDESDKEFQDFLMELINNLALKYLDDIVEYEAEIEADEDMKQDNDIQYSRLQEMTANIPQVDDSYYTNDRYQLVTNFPEDNEADSDAFGDLIDDDGLTDNDQLEDEPVGAEFWKQLLNEMMMEDSNSPSNGPDDADDWLKPDRGADSVPLFAM